MHLVIEKDGEYVSMYIMENNKPLQVPREQCHIRNFQYPSTDSVRYWNHYGYDRLTFKIE